MGAGMTWAPIPGKDPSRKRPDRPTPFVDYEVATKARLATHSKAELVDEVVRLQELVRGVAVELGMARRSKSSELTIEVQFVAHIMALVKAGWSNNIE